MNESGRFTAYITLRVLVGCLMSLGVQQGWTQSFKPNNDLDSSFVNGILTGKDSILMKFDSVYIRMLRNRANAMSKDSSWHSFPPSKLNTSALQSIKLFKNQGIILKRPIVRLQDGLAQYAFTCRSNIDTPNVERNIAAHNLSGYLGLTLASFIPLRITYYVQQSNSSVYRDIRNIQVSLNPVEMQNLLRNHLRGQLSSLADASKDSLTQKLLDLKSMQKIELRKWLENPLQKQKLVEANEIIHIPNMSYDFSLPDSINAARVDSLQQAARRFIALYNKVDTIYTLVNHQADSLQMVYDTGLKKIEEMKNLASGNMNAGRFLKARRSGVERSNLPVPGFLNKYKWLLGIRNFSVGHNPISYSELTAKGINVNGLNIEYNSWYYFAATVGTIDYTFRDFAVGRENRPSQPFWMLRTGIGKVEYNHLIFSVFKGQKQLLYSTPGRNQFPAVSVSGISAEGRLHLNRYTFVTAELAESFSPELVSRTGEVNTKTSFSDFSNKAVSFRFYSMVPQTNTRLEGFYKRTGINFQSFGSFQINAANQSWYVKAEQQVWNRKLRFSASLRSNEFTNPLLVQNYKNNTVFKTITVTLKVRKYPVVSIGYVPNSQLTKLDSQIIESRFQSLIASAYHTYRLGEIRATSTLMFNRFYHSHADTSMLYYNATSLYAAQNFFFNAFTGNISVTSTRNASYVLDVLDAGIQLVSKKQANISFGTKLNYYNRSIYKPGAYISATITVRSQDFVSVSFEHGYLPGVSKGLVRNDMGAVQFTKRFAYRR